MKPGFICYREKGRETRITFSPFSYTFLETTMKNKFSSSSLCWARALQQPNWKEVVIVGGEQLSKNWFPYRLLLLLLSRNGSCPLNNAWLDTSGNQRTIHPFSRYFHPLSILVRRNYAIFQMHRPYLVATSYSVQNHLQAIQLMNEWMNMKHKHGLQLSFSLTDALQKMTCAVRNTDIHT